MVYSLIIFEVHHLGSSLCIVNNHIIRFIYSLNLSFNRQLMGDHYVSHTLLSISSSVPTFAIFRSTFRIIAIKQIITKMYHIILQNLSLKSTFSPFCDYFISKDRSGYSTLHPEKESAFTTYYTFVDCMPIFAMARKE